MKRYKSLYEIKDKETIFIRLATPKEMKSNTEKNKAYNSFPNSYFEGYDKGYMPYGEQGKGFYYIKGEK